MFILGHSALTLAAARAVDQDIDMRPAILLALAPDIIDKPVSWLFPALVNDNSRGFGHTFLAAVVLLAVLAALRLRPKHCLLLWGCFVGHFLLDRMWLHENPQVFLWPLLGPMPPPLPRGPIRQQIFFFNLKSEAVGLGVALFLARRHRLFAPGRFRSFLHTGRFG